MWEIFREQDGPWVANQIKGFTSSCLLVDSEVAVSIVQSTRLFLFLKMFNDLTVEDRLKNFMYEVTILAIQECGLKLW